MIEKNYNFYMKTDLSKYMGQWIAISDKKIVSHNKGLKKVYRETRGLLKEKKPLFVKAPDEETMLFLPIAEKTLAKDWFSKEEDEAWNDL